VAREHLCGDPVVGLIPVALDGCIVFRPSEILVVIDYRLWLRDLGREARTGSG
jgi:hypothetical protein